MRNLCSPGFLYAFPGITGSVASINSTGPYFVPTPDCEQAERQGFQMRKFKTPEEKRTNYIYYPLQGTRGVIKIGMVDEEKRPVTAEMIVELHSFDDTEIDGNRRALYHAPVRFQGYADVDDFNKYLACPDENPLEKLMLSVEEQKQANLLERLMAAYETLPEKQQTTIYKKFWLNQSNTQIANDEGVSEAAIRNRLKRIYASLARKISV